MIILKFKFVKPGQEFALPSVDNRYYNSVKIEVFVATNDGRAVSLYDGRLIDVDKESNVVLEEEITESEYEADEVY